MWENGGMETPKYLLCGYLIFAWPCYTGGKKSIPMCKNMNDSHKYWPWHLKKKKKHDVEKTLIWKALGIPMFIAELLTIAKTQMQPKCPSIDEQIRKMWYKNIYSWRQAKL